MRNDEPSSVPEENGRARRQLAIFSEMLPWVMQAARRDIGFLAHFQQRLKRDQRFGSTDRKIYRELAYSAIRFLPWLEQVGEVQRAELALWLAPEDSILKAMRSVLAADWPQQPEVLEERAAILTKRFSGKPFAIEALLPNWMRHECPEAFESVFLNTIFSRPPLWLRMRPEFEASAFDEISQLGCALRRNRFLSCAVAVEPSIDLSRTRSFSMGAFEVQDVGSQMILELVRPRPGTRWLDACAGAGGKTLQLAFLLGGCGSIDAIDVRSDALAELRTRATRAQLDTITIVHEATGEYDGVLVDAPCSGSGTWRRHPHLKWKTSRGELRRHAERQLAILLKSAAFVREGGQLVYATCSLARSENEGVVEAFLKERDDFAVSALRDARGCEVRALGVAILPQAHDGDGFFVSILDRKSR